MNDQIFSVVAKTPFYRPLVNYKSQLLRLLTFQRLFVPLLNFVLTVVCSLLVLLCSLNNCFQDRCYNRASIGAVQCVTVQFLLQSPNLFEGSYGRK